MTLRLVPFIGKAMTPLLPEVARLCTIVFRDWPHLYDGDGRYDPHHLATLAQCPRAILVVASDGSTPIGIATGLPLADATPNIRAPFAAGGWTEARFFYFPEAVLLSPYRGRGIGAAYFRLREAHARAVTACDYACFCAVQRAPDHPAHPPAPRSLETFWRHRGYAPVLGLTCTMAWREFGQSADSEQTLLFWAKSLTGRALPMHAPSDTKAPDSRG
jgi:GNAT superfamily N-acetyltransferase